MIAFIMGAPACSADKSIERKFMSAANIANPDSMGALPSFTKRIATQERRSLKEASAAVITSSQPGIVFTLNDSGNEPELFALDTAGNSRGVWHIDGASNVDWEALSSGPCSGVSLVTARGCLYIADTGDNNANRAQVTLYRVSEPTAGPDDKNESLGSERLILKYPDRAHDVEAVYTTTRGDTYLVTKRALARPDGTLRNALVYRVPASAWGTGDPYVAELVDSLPIVPGSSQLRKITDASLSHDGRLLAVRTYGQVYIFLTDTATGRVMHDTPPAVCNIQFVERQHGEGVTWFGATRDLLLDSEGRNEPLHRIRCPLPAGIAAPSH
jgi:hypothetical protein